MQKKNFLTTYLPYFLPDRYRKQTISFFRPYHIMPLNLILSWGIFLLTQKQNTTLLSLLKNKCYHHLTLLEYSQILNISFYFLYISMDSVLVIKTSYHIIQLKLESLLDYITVHCKSKHKESSSLRNKHYHHLTLH